MRKRFYGLLFCMFLLVMFLNGCGKEEITGNAIRVVNVAQDKIPIPGEKIYCNQESRNTRCEEVEHRVCGWFDEDANCEVYPCSKNYRNECFACHDRKVEYSIDGKCAIDEKNFEGKKESKYIEMAREYVENLNNFHEFNGRELKVTGIGQASCSGCDFVELNYYLDNNGIPNRGIVKVTIKNFEIIDTEYRQEKI